MLQVSEGVKITQIGIMFFVYVKLQRKNYHPMRL